MSSRPRANSTSSRLRQRPGAGDLVEPQPHVVRLDLVDPELVERLAHVEIALADRDHADLRLTPAGQDDVVEVVRAHEGQHGVALEVLEPRLLLEEAVRRADVEAARRHAELVVARDHDLDPVEAAVGGRRRLDVVLDAFQRRPGAAEAAQGEAVEAVVDQLLDAGRVQDRRHHVDEGEFRLMRDGRGFGGVVVAHQRQHAAVPRGARHVGVAEHVAGAVDARPLAVPDPEDAVVLAVAAQLRLLRAPERGRGKLLVEAGLEDDVVGLKPLLGAPEVLVEAADRRAAIAGDEAGGVQPGAAVALALHQQHADDRLRAGDEDPVLRQVVFVVEGDVSQRSRGSSLSIGHRPFPPRGSTPIRRVQVRSVQLCQ